MAKRKRLRDIEAADANAELRFGPEASGIQALLGQAQEDFKTDRRVAGSTARTVIRGARRARPLLKSIYNQAAHGVKVAQDDVEAAFNQAGVTPDNAFRLVAETEGTAYRQKMAAEAAHARRQTVRDVQEAKLGKVFAMGAARDRYNQTVGSLQQRGQELLGQRQAFLTSEVARMKAERQDRNNARDIALIQQNRDPRTGKPYPGSREPFKRASNDDRSQMRTALARALDIARDYPKANIDRAAAASELREGVRASGDDPGFRAIGDQLAVQVALDMAYRGSISNKTRAELLDQGFRPSELSGVRYIADKRKRQKVAHKLRVKRAASQGGAIGGAASQIPAVGDVFGL